MYDNNKINQAVKLAIKTHEIDQKQKRKGKDIPYIIHPLTVGILLACEGVSVDVIAAGILHDTLEDSVPENKVTKEMLTKQFDENVAMIVDSVTEKNKNLSWEDRKSEALAHIKNFSQESLLVKSADVVNNGFELLDDYKKDGEMVFERFNASKEKILLNYLNLIRTIAECWSENPFIPNLTYIARELQMINSSFSVNYPARMLKSSEFDEHEVINCPVCHWHGSSEENISYSDDLFDVTCPVCDKMLLIVK